VESGGIFFHHSKPPPHSALFLIEFLAKNKVTVLPHHPYSPDLAPCEFVPIQKIKRELKGSIYNDITMNQVQLWNVLATFQTMYSENVSNYGVMAGLIV
jgi:hypothetical protein